MEQNTQKEPQKLNEIKLDYIMDYCSGRGQADVEWLQSLYAELPKDKDGNERDLTFIEIRTAFAKKYYPHFMSGTKTMRERIMELKAVSTSTYDSGILGTL